MVGTEARLGDCAVHIGVRISSVCAMFVSSFGVRMIRSPARETEETLATGIVFPGLGTRQQGQTRDLPQVVTCRWVG